MSIKHLTNKNIRNIMLTELVIMLGMRVDMDYIELAEQLVNMRASMPQVKMERAMSQMARG